MGEFVEKKWEYSNELPVSFNLKEGKRNLLIADVLFDKDAEQYTICFEDIDEPDYSGNVKYWMKFEDKETGQFKPNNTSIRALNNLGMAVANKPLGRPEPSSIIGAVVVGKVVYPKNSSYPKIYDYYPAKDSVVLMCSKLRDANGEPAQYSIPDDADDE